MGTGVGEAALAAEAIGAAEAATAGAGFLEGMAGVSALEGAGVAGLGLGTGAGLGTGLASAGGLGALSPAFQTALGQTAAVMPEVAAQTAQFANMGAMPGVDAVLGAGQIGDPALLNEGYRAASVASNTPGLTQGVQPLQAKEALPSIDRVQNIAAQGFNTPAATTLSESLPAANPLDFGAPPPETPGIGNLLQNATQPLQDWWDKQNKLTKYGLGATGALQAAKYLNKQQGVAPAEKYSGPLSKFTYSPDTYTPYTYKPYVAGGPVEEMSNRNAIGANTGYPQSDIQQGAYATPRQTPVSRNVVAGAGDVGVDQMTGMERMAEGGATEAKPEMPAVAASQQNFSDFLSRYQGAPEQAGLTPFNPTEQAMPEIMASRQNFADFLARYQNLPITEAAPPPVVYKDLYAAGPGPKEDVNPARPAYESFGGYIGAKAGGLMASGGIADLGGYSDGGRLLRGPGDGMSDNIPATIGRKQPARLADGEFVVPADVVSGLGNGSTEAGAKQLYKMLDKVRSARTGTKKQGKQIKPEKYTPA